MSCVASPVEPLREVLLAGHTTRQRLALYALIALMVAGGILRARLANTAFLDPDEAQHYTIVHQPSAAAMFHRAVATAHPPLYFVVLYAWQHLGSSEFFLRLPSLIAGILLIYVTFLWLRELLDPLAGVLGATMVALSPPLISLSAEARHYSLLLLWMMSALYFFERARRSKGAAAAAAQDQSPSTPASARAKYSQRHLLWSGIFLWLAILTHYSAAWFVVALGTYGSLSILREKPPKCFVRLWAAVQAGGVAIYAALFAVQLSHVHGGQMEGEAVHGWLSRFYYQGGGHVRHFLWTRTLDLFSFFFPHPRAAHVGVVLVLVAVGILFYRRWKPISPLDRLPLTALLLLPFGLGAAASMIGVYPYGGTRHDVFLAPFIFAALTIAVSQYRRIWLRAAGLLVFAAMLAPCVMHPYSAENSPPESRRKQFARDAIAFLRSTVPAGSTIFANSQTKFDLVYYLGAGDGRVLGRTKLGEFNAGSYHVITAEAWDDSAETFTEDLAQVRRQFQLNPNSSIWAIQIGWMSDLYDKLRDANPGSGITGRNFGDHICVFRVPVNLSRKFAEPR